MERLPFKLRRARLQLMLKHPYLASAVARFPICIRTRQEGVSTMATDGYRIYANTEFVERISSDQLLGVLAHELMHNLLAPAFIRKLYTMGNQCSPWQKMTQRK